MNLIRQALILILSLIIVGCSDSPTDNNPRKISNQGTLTYKIIEYGNSPNYNQPATVIYKNLDKEMVIETIKTPWEKSFEYEYTVAKDSLVDFDSHLIIQYEGEDIAIKGIIEAEDREEATEIGSSFTINLKNVFKLPK
ncbi:hypothetical protein CK503_00230 [Aliifodinibius salipaludis]|uniref:Uncharacterized protein n=1 Tax=Fodinibius salipaludis TaxID=2032627 RepID=A0A2A2GF25_9BACT|nr:hypothetical protein [Aliifodinibius salipaludis]PAU95527.1 hypothetical protein CK503_00230 [Aliifodinibius salipaludis]